MFSNGWVEEEHRRKEVGIDDIVVVVVTLIPQMAAVVKVISSFPLLMFFSYNQIRCVKRETIQRTHRRTENRIEQIDFF